MFGGFKMLGGVLVFGIITAADVSAGQAETQVHPVIPGLKAFLTTIRSHRLRIGIGDYYMVAGLFFLRHIFIKLILYAPGF
jgi:hypothetical protein